MANRLKEKYLNEVVPALTEQFNYSSVMAVPKVDKIVLNMGVGEAVSNAKSHLSLKLKNQSPASVFVKVLRSVQKLPFVVNVCTNSWINWFQFHFHVYVTSTVFQQNHLMDAETTHLV